MIEPTPPTEGAEYVGDPTAGVFMDGNPDEEPRSEHAIRADGQYARLAPDAQRPGIFVAGDNRIMMSGSIGYDPYAETVRRSAGFTGVTVWLGYRSVTFPDDTTTDAATDAATLTPVERAVAVARLRALARTLERG